MLKYASARRTIKQNEESKEKNIEMSAGLYWWSRYGNFPPGVHSLPHMGKVVGHYREKRYRTQEDFAIAAGVDKRTVQEWETSIMTADMERRIFLAKMLKIPPALLGLDWRLVVYKNNKGEYVDPLEHMADLLEEDGFYAYEDILVMGHEYIHNGGPISIAYRIDRRLQKLVKIVQNVRGTDREAWQTLLCRYYQLSTRIKQQCLLDSSTASEHARLAIDLALELGDVELIASSFVHSACTSDQQGNLDGARSDIAAAMGYVKRVRNNALKGNIYLESANINTPYAVNDRKLQDQCKTWQDQAANMLYKGNIEADESFFKFNLSAVHHEKAKTLLHWQKTEADRKAIGRKISTALETLSPDLAVWKVYYLMTEAKLYFADHDIEGCAQSAKAALKMGRAMHSKVEEENIRNLYLQLNEKAPLNPYVRNLGMELGQF